MGYVLAFILDGALINIGRKFVGRWGWRGYALTLGIFLAVWIMLMATR